MEDRVRRIALDLLQELRDALGLGAEVVGRLTLAMQVCGVKIQIVESLFTQSVRDQEWVPDEAIDPPFLRWYLVSLHIKPS